VFKDDTMKTAKWLSESEFQLRAQRVQSAAAKAAKAEAEAEEEQERVRAWNSEPKNKGKPPPPRPASPDPAEPEKEEGAQQPTAPGPTGSPGKRHKVLAPPTVYPMRTVTIKHTTYVTEAPLRYLGDTLSQNSLRYLSDANLPIAVHS